MVDDIIISIFQPTLQQIWHTFLFIQLFLKSIVCVRRKENSKSDSNAYFFLNKS